MHTIFVVWCFDCLVRRLVLSMAYLKLKSIKLMIWVFVVWSKCPSFISTSSIVVTRYNLVLYKCILLLSLFCSIAIYFFINLFIYFVVFMICRYHDCTFAFHFFFLFIAICWLVLIGYLLVSSEHWIRWDLLNSDHLVIYYELI